MSEKSKDPRPTERTPKGYEVPVPKRGEFFANLRKVARIVPRKDSAAGGSASSPKK